MEKEANSPAQKLASNKWLILGCSAFLCLLILAGAVIGVSYVQRSHSKIEWVGFRGSFEGRTGYMNEESEVDEDRRVIIHVNAEGYKLGINNSISLHDYQNGLLATRVMESGTCMIINLIDTYEEAVAALHQFNKTGVSTLRPLRWFDAGVIVPQADLEEQIGSTLADFCRGFPTVRLHEIPAGSVQTRKRRSVQPVMRAVCIQNEFCYIRDREIDQILDNIDIYVRN